MGEKEKTQLLGATFNGNVTFNGPMYDIHDNVNVYIHNEKIKREKIIDENENSYKNETENSLDLIFRDALDIAKVKRALDDVLTRKDRGGKLIFRQKNLVYVIYKFFMENDWFEKDNQVKFREWMIVNYGVDFSCNKSNFDGVDSKYKNNAIEQWRTAWTPFITAADALNERFKGKDNPDWEKYFLKPNRYISHHLRQN